MCKTFTDVFQLCCGYRETYIQTCANKKAGGLCLIQPGKLPHRVINQLEAIVCPKCILIRTGQPRSIPESALIPYYWPKTPIQSPSLPSRMMDGLHDAAEELHHIARTTKFIAKVAFKGPTYAVRSQDECFCHDGTQRVRVKEIDFKGRCGRQVTKKGFVNRKIVPFLDKIRD